MNATMNILKSKTLYFSILLTVLIFYSIKAIQPSFSNFILTTPSGITSATDFPFFSASTESGYYKLNGTITMGKHTSPILRIIPDDEIHFLSVNKVPVDITMIPYDQRKDYTKGFIYDLSPFLHSGDNEIEIVYSDQGGLMGIVISAVGSDLFYNFLYTLLVVVSLLIALKVAKICRLKTPLKILFISALLIRLAYFVVTPADVRDHDLGDHIGYTDYLSTHWIPPSIDYATGGAFFHPPLYYYTGAIVYKATKIFEPHNKVALHRVQQILSLFYSMGFVLFGLLILNELFRLYDTDEEAEQISTKKIYAPIKNEWAFWITGALFVFWPSSIIHSVRIGNDPMLYFLFSASLYYIFQWYQSDRKKRPINSKRDRSYCNSY